MRLPHTLVAAALLFPNAALSETDFSALIGDVGIGPAVARFDALEDRTATESFALAGARFLGGIEAALQVRYSYALGANGLGSAPIFRLRIDPNATPEPLEPAVIETLFADLVAAMDGVIAELTNISDQDSVALRLDLGNIWFDIDASGTREEGEGLGDIWSALAGQASRPGAPTDAALPSVRFDTADAAWLAAYAHLLSAIGEMVLAYPPTEAIAEILDASDALAALTPEELPRTPWDSEFHDEADNLAIAYLALGQQPQPEHSRAAASHLREMIRQNRAFWRRLDAETDNESEWIPSPSQTSALGITLPPDTGPRWLAVLEDAEALLDGRKLVPHWRMGPSAGINLQRLLDDPAPVDIVGWFHGYSLLPYAEPGEPVSAESWRQFSRMLQGDAVLMALWLN